MNKIMTYNIRFDNPADGDHDWSHRREKLAQMVLEHGPDVLGTQEGRRPQLEDLEGLLTNYRLVQDHREWIEHRMYPCLFIKKDIQVIESGDFWLSTTPYISGSKSFDSEFPRLCTWIKIHDTYIFNLHLDHVLDETREKQIEVVINEIRKMNTDSYIIMGDFNDSPQGKVRNHLEHLIDPWKELKKEEVASHLSFSGRHYEFSRIDWILHTKNIQFKNIQMDSRKIDGVYPSDHYPIILELK